MVIDLCKIHVIKFYRDQYSDRYHFVNSKNCFNTTAPIFHCVMSVSLSDNKAMAAIVKSISNPHVTLWATFVPCSHILSQLLSSRVTHGLWLCRRCYIVTSLVRCGKSMNMSMRLLTSQAAQRSEPMPQLRLGNSHTGISSIIFRYILMTGLKRFKIF